MFNEKLQIGVKGYVNMNITKSGEVSTFEGPNEISETSALDVILSCLCRVPNEASVDTIVFLVDEGGVGEYPINITNSEINFTEKSITFIAQALADSFSGTITGLRLIIGSYNLFLATKTDMAVEKDDVTNIEVRWKITLSPCEIPL
jgi:hypothetical protein